jgi:TetR/AcrR family transcriptional repressor of bet genes
MAYHRAAGIADADDIALGITTLIDGLWLRLGLQPDGVTRDQALRQVKDYVCARLAAVKTPAA